MLDDDVVHELADRAYQYQSLKYQEALARTAPPAMRLVHREIPPLHNCDSEMQEIWRETVRIILGGYPEIVFGDQTSKYRRAAASAYALAMTLLDGNPDMVAQVYEELKFRMESS